ncbi:HC-toxin synthetase [Coccidioides immitis H538.4]|uniref:HC-toxin synthetase n=1 Tax=Coccidioides immitis H538.4 TaxID=396776 RepID=A0A0J8RYN8_COCIT|nr:HC-toxin synthetase [Coccidioides immitis H538.4]
MQRDHARKPPVQQAREVDVTPVIDVVEELRKACSHVLKIPLDEVEPETSSFLHLGGDSISAMQVMARCRSQGLTVAVQDIMQAKSINQLATLVKLSKKNMNAEKSEKAEMTGRIEKAEKPQINNKIESIPQCDIILELQKVWSHALNLALDETELDCSFLHLGGDSISAMQVMAKCRSQGIKITVKDIMQARSIRELSTQVTFSGGRRPRAEAEVEIPQKLEDTRSFNLSPIQQLYFDCVGDNWKQFNQSVLMRLTSERSPDDIARAITKLVTIHPMLRARFEKNEAGNWHQWISGDILTSYRFRAHNDVKPSQVKLLIEDSQKCLDIENGPLFAVDMFDLPKKESQISLVAHHLIIDVMSWRVILQDLEDVLAGTELQLHTSTSFQDWCKLQTENAQKETPETVLPASDVPTADFDYWGMSNKSNLNGDIQTEEIELSASSTKQLATACHENFGADTVDVILASILLSFHREFTDRKIPPPVYNEGHGREPWSPELDLSSTVGWFTTMSPIYLPYDAETSGDLTLLDTILWVRDLRRRTPGKGRPYFAYRYLTDDGEKYFGKHWPMEICFNYLGQMQQNEQSIAILQPVGGAGGQSINTLSDIGAEVPRFSLIEISAVITDGTLKVSFGFNKHMKRKNGILNWLSGCNTLLEEAGTFKKINTQSPREFPLLPLVYGSLTKLQKQVQELGISIDEEEDAYPSSPMQQGILISQLKDPQKYSFHFAYEVKSNKRNHRIDGRRLEAAWKAVVSRHPSLRTVFINSVSTKGLMDQVVLKKVMANTLYLEAETAEKAFASVEPFDCSEKRPPHRFAVCQTFDGRVFCKVDISHAISDGTSMRLMIQDLTAAYEATSAIEPGPLYSEFIQYLQRTPKEEALKYWKTYLSGIEPCLLPSLAEVPIPSKREPKDYVLTINRGSELQKFCRKHGLTPANVLQLIWGLVLVAYTGTDEVCFGVVSSGRNVPVNGIQEAVGAFINMIIFRLKLSNNTSLVDTFRQLQTDFMRSLEYQSCSLTEVQHALGFSDTPLFNTAFTFQKGSDADSPTPMITFEHFDSTDPNEFNLSINVSLIDSSLLIGFGYWTDTISDAHVVNIAKTFEHLLDELINNNGDARVVGDLDLLGEHSCKQIRTWNSQPPKIVNKCIHELIQQQALLRPRTTKAVEGWDASFTYAELDAIASRLAGHLIGFGVGPDVYVPLFFEKSAWSVVAQLAVLKAGGAFVHVDPTHPESRLRLLIEDVGADFIVCSPKYREKASKVTKTIFVLDPQDVRKLPNTQATPPTPPRPSNAAYIIFTSGTTGRPKGTVIEHGAICTSSLAHGEAFLMNGSSRVFQFASYTFDASVIEITTCLIMGGCVCVPSDEERMNDIANAMTKYRANWVFLTPSVLSTIKPGQVPTLKVIAVGGEPMPEKIIEEWKGGPAIINTYGPTENSAISSASPKVDTNGVTVDKDRLNIGPAVGCRAWVVDPNNYNRLVPVGAVGELLLEGRTVGRGYLNNPQKTAEVFLDRPEFTEDRRLRDLIPRQCRMYRTGDLVRWNPNGTINFISRKDTQIKLNGQRVELGEIEHQCIANLPEKTQAAVDLVVPSDSSKKTLTVFFTVSFSDVDKSILTKADGSSCDELLIPMDDTIRSVAKSLETGLGACVPSYMIPRLFIPVSRLPWTSSGKLDRNRLRNMVQDLSKESVRLYRPKAQNNKPASTSSIEKKLQALWEKILNLPPGSVSATDSFFKLGGDSLTAMQLAGSARAQGMSLTFSNIFKFPILSDMVSSCGVLKKTEAPSQLKPFSLLPKPELVEDVKQEAAELCRVSESDIHDIYPASSLQEGFITLAIKQPGAYIAQSIFRLDAAVDIPRFKAAWQTVVNDLDMLRTRIVHTASSDFLQVVLKKETFAWGSSSSLESISDEATQLPAHNGGQLARFSLVDDRKLGSRFFVLSMSHALYDGWSLPLMLKRVENAYFGRVSPPQQASYSRFVQYLKNADLDASDKFWRSKLAGISSDKFPQVPLSAGDKPLATRTISSRTNIPTQQSGDVTLPTIIRAAWALVVGSHTGTDDVCFGETLTGRNINVPFITEIVGPTLTTVPTRIQIDRKETLANYLQKVQQESADVVPHQHVGLQRINRLDGDTAVACDFQNLLVVQTSHEKIQEDFWDFQDLDNFQNFLTYPLAVECNIGDSYVDITAYHNENAINSWQMQRILDQFSSVIQQIVEASETNKVKVNDIEVFSEKDKETVAWWNRRKPLALNECIHDLFTRKAESQPSSPAVCDAEVELTYEELRSHASRLALHLISIGVGPEVLVPICLDKSVWVVVTLMAVLMAGGAFVALDPLHPTSRHKEIIIETHAEIVLCSPKYRERFVDFVKHVMAVDRRSITNLPRGDYGRLSGRANPENTAYVVFTSGSTGRAKGVVIEHKAFCSSSAAFAPATLMDSRSRTLQFASLSFDAAVMDILTPLSLGGCVCVPTEEERLKDIAGAIRRMRVTWACLTPSVTNIIDPANVPSIKTLVCGGETLFPEVILKWGDKVNLINAYGPSECAVVSTTNQNVCLQNPSSIGVSIAATTAWVLDPVDHDRLAPLGGVGELALSGSTLAREYLNNPEKTSEAFVEDLAWAVRFSGVVPVRRIYKTGDLVRYNPDGSLEFIGRKDNQVKLHGQRMELGEIEHRLYIDRRIKHAVVLMPNSGLCKGRLVAIVSLRSLPSEASGISGGDLELVNERQLFDEVCSQLNEVQDNLSNQLPPFMIPQTWVVVHAIPLLASGKIDRKKAIAWIENIDEKAYEQIMGANEVDGNEVQASDAAKVVQKVWSTVLNIPLSKIRLNQSFMSLGGDSIAAMSVMSRCRREGINLSFHDILRCKSIMSLVERVTSTANTVQKDEVINVPFSLSPIQKLYFESSNVYTGSGRFNQSFSLRITKQVHPVDVRQAIEAIVSKHSMLRARFSQDALGIWQQRITNDLGTSYRYRTHNIAGTHQIPSIISESQICLDIENGPIFAADLFNCRNDCQMLFLAAHHLCVDMVSWRIMLQDLQDYLETGSLSADKPLPFQVWCSMQAEHRQKHTSRKLLPFDVQPSNFTYWGMEGKKPSYKNAEQLTFIVDEKITNLALVDCHKAFQTDPVDLFLTVIGHSFGRVFRDREVPTLFNEGHGREPWDASLDISRTVGWFTTICPISVPVNSGANDKYGALETLRRTKDIRHSIPDNGRLYFAERFLSSRRVATTDIPMEILFNYLGRMQQLERDDSLLQQADFVSIEHDIFATSDVGPNTPRLALFEITAVVQEEKIQFSFMFDKSMARTNDIRRWVAECKNTLEETVIRLAQTSPEPTLSDYPLLPLSYEGLKKLIKITYPKAGIKHCNEVEDIYPCSPMQEGILLSQLRNSDAYLVNCIFEAKSKQSHRRVDTEKLAHSWERVVSRHAALRTVFVDSLCKGSTFDQLVVKSVDSGIIFVHCHDSEAIDKLNNIKLKDTNLKKRPKLPHQFIICTTNSGRVLIKLEINHAIIDGGSVGIMMADLIAAYEDRLPDGSGPLFSDYIRFIRQQSPEQEIHFWKNYLEGIQPCHIPKHSNQRKPQRCLSAVEMEFNRFPELHQMCEKLGVTLANVMHTAWAFVLRSYTHSDDVCFGYISAGRDVPVDGIQDAVGAFINMLCCRVLFSSSSSTEDVLRKVHDDYLASLPHQRCSLAQVQHELGLAGKALYNTALSIQNHSRSSDAAEEDLMFETLSAHDPSEYVITVNVETAKNDEKVVLRYWSDAIPDFEAKKYASSMAEILTKFLDQPRQKVATRDPAIKPSLEISPSEDQERSDSPAKQESERFYEQSVAGSSADLTKVVDSCVREVIQQMLENGTLKSNPSVNMADLVDRKISEILGQNQALIKPVPGSSHGTFSPYRKKAGLDLPSTSSDSYEVLDYNPKDDPDTHSMAAQIRRRGRSAVIEKKLLSLWSSMLEMDEDAIAPDDNFFELGGDSLTAMKLVGAAREDGLALTVADVFRNPVFEDMVTMIRVASLMTAYEDGDGDGDANSNGDLSSYHRTVPVLRSAAKSELYQRFSLVKATNIDAFLQSNICPKVGVFKGGIADVLPVTDFQGLAITGSLLESKWMLNYFFFDGNGPLDLKQLKLSAFRLVNSIDVLRTVFLPHGDRFLQVVLRKMRPDFFVYETESNMDEFTAMLQQRDRDQGPRLGEPFFNFIVVKRKDSDHHRIIIRISHAQYDGVCLPKIFLALQSAYQDEPLPPMSSFANYVRSTASTITSDHYQHWRALLKGSRMTEIVRRHGPNYRRSAGATTQLKQTILLPPIAHGSITTATVVKSAWALVLAQLTGRSDVVFGHTISGWTALDLLRFVQDQQVSNMPYEALGFREISKHCTEWPDWTNYTTVVQHQNVSYGSEMELGGNTYKMEVLAQMRTFPDFSVISTPKGSDRCEISLSFSQNGDITPIFAQKVLNMLCNIASNFTAEPNSALMSPTELGELPPQVIDETGRQNDNYFVSSQLQGLSRADLLVLSDVLSRSWRQVLGDDNTNGLNLESSFFDLNGDIMGLAQVSWLLEQEGFKVRIEDLIDHPTMLGQMAAMCSSKVEQSKMTFMDEESSIPATPTTPKSEKKSWLKAMNMARKIVKRNTRSS